MNVEIPKILWILWFQGWENAPNVVQKCKTTWIEHNPDWQIHFLTTENLSQFIDLDKILPGYKEKEMQPEALSNVIRLALLVKYGGVWADSTVYCNQPLSTWLPQNASSSGFFAFANPGPDRLLSTWFLAAAPDHTITKKWYAENISYWSKRTELHNHRGYHHLFRELYEKDETIKQLWDASTKLSDDAPHYFFPYEETFFQPVSKIIKRAILQPATPVFKLTFKYDEQKVKEDSVIQYLLSDKKKKETSKVIIIVGMHRSGTSLTASLLQQSGLNIGEELLGSATGNKHGHYENFDFFNFHKKVLEKYNHHHDGWDEAELEQLDREYEEEAKKIIELNESEVWGWKDPRTTLFLNFWARLLPEAYFLFIYRSPEEVVDSLFRRATDDYLIEHPEKCIDVWLYYNKLILKYFERFNDRSLLLSIHTVINSYPQCVLAINEKFKVNLKPDSGNIFDRESFNDHAQTGILTSSLYSVKPEVKKVYEELLSKSWYPSTASYEPELLLKHENKANQFFKQWRDYRLKGARKNKQYEAQIQQLTHEVNNLKTLVKAKEDFGLDKQAEVEWMKKTFFWKIRTVYKKTKALIGLEEK